MLKINSFIRDERGSVSIWSLLWFTAFCAILGLAVDITGAMNTKAKLQSVSDAAAHAGAVELLPTPAGAIPTALTFADLNLPYVDDAVMNSDITLGHWDRAARTFDPDSTDTINAVQVFARRDESRANQLFTSFLAVTGFHQWNIGTMSIAMHGDESMLDDCRLGALLARGLLEQTSLNLITGNLCLYGETQFKINQNNYITCGVELRTPGEENWKTGQAPQEAEEPCDPEMIPYMSNDQRISHALKYDELHFSARQEYENMRDYLYAIFYEDFTPSESDLIKPLPSYITAIAGPMSVSTFNNKVRNGQLVEGTLYRVDCGQGNQKLTLTGIVTNLGIYTDCEVNVTRDQDVSAVRPTRTETGMVPNCDPDASTCEYVDWVAEITEPNLKCWATEAAAIAAVGEAYLRGRDTYDVDPYLPATYRDGTTDDYETRWCGIEPGSNGLWDNVFILTTAHEEEGFAAMDGSNANVHESISFPNNMQLGRIDGCTQGGGVRLYMGGSASTPSGTVINGLQLVALGDVLLAAKANGVMGIHVEVEGDLKYAAQGLMGGCNASSGSGQSDMVITVFPVAIVQ